MKYLKKIPTQAIEYAYAFPVFRGNQLIFSSRLAVADELGTLMIRCIEVESEKVCWEYRSREVGWKILCAPAVGDHLMVFATADAVFALDPATGKEIWHTNMTLSWPAVIMLGGELFVTQSNELVKVDITNGKVKKRRKFRNTLLDGKLVEYKGHLLVGTTTERFFEVERENLEVMLDYKKTGTCNLIPSTDLILSKTYSFIHCFDLEKNEFVWKKRVKGAGEPQPDLSGDRFFYIGQNTVCAHSIQKGKKIWETEANLLKLVNLDEHTFLSVSQDANNKFELVTIDKDTGKVAVVSDGPIMYESEDPDCNGYPMPLEITVSEEYVALACGAGEIYIFDKNASAVESASLLETEKAPERFTVRKELSKERERKIKMDENVKNALISIDFVKRYEELSNTFNRERTPDGEELSSAETKRVKEIIEKLGYSPLYDSRERFYKIKEEEIGGYSFSVHIVLRYGLVELIWVARENGELLTGSPWNSYVWELKDRSYTIKSPVMGSYEDLEEILKISFEMYEDFKKNVVSGKR